MGRPLLNPSAKRNNAIACYLTESEYERVYHVATKQDKHLSAWFREVIMRECEMKEAKK